MERLWSQLLGSRRVLRSYYPLDVFTEARLAARSWFGSRHIVHFLYGEDQFLFLKRWSRPRGIKVVVSLHQPPSKAHLLVSSFDHWSGIDGAVLMAKTQESFVRRLAPNARIAVVPHGVDTDFFSPGGPPPDGPPWRILIVGSWLRDFEAAAATIRAIAEAGKSTQFRFTVVSSALSWSSFAGLDAELLTGIPDEHLLALYRSAHFVFLPLSDSTANNALLEALACGVPVLGTDVGGIREYAGEDAAFLRPSQPPTMAGLDFCHELLRLTASPERLREARQAARSRALGFAWPVVVRQMEDFYDQVSASADA
jgi:glycosyltransferase involved in cell wall biosynthesis